MRNLQIWVIKKILGNQMHAKNMNRIMQIEIREGCQSGSPKQCHISKDKSMLAYLRIKVEVMSTIFQMPKKLSDTRNSVMLTQRSHLKGPLDLKVRYTTHLKSFCNTVLASQKSFSYIKLLCKRFLQFRHFTKEEKASGRVIQYIGFGLATLGLRTK